MPLTDEEINQRKLARTLRTPTQGNRMQAASSGNIDISPSRVTTIIDNNGKVRRRWQPGDSWSDRFYFGGGDS